jgi:hypothetical protein
MLYRESGQFKSTYGQDQQIFPILQDRVAMVALLLVAFVAVPIFGDQYWLSAIITPFLILSLAALGLNILTGYAGQLSLGTAAFMAIRRIYGLQRDAADPAHSRPGRIRHRRPFCGSGRHRLRLAEPEDQGAVSRRGDPRLPVLRPVADQPRRLVLELQLLGRDHFAADGDPRL